MLTPVCGTAAIQARQRLGQVSERSDEPTAHSPPMPRAARNRKISRCHHVVAAAERPVKTAYVRIVGGGARLGPGRSPSRPKNPPPRAQPTRKAAWIHEVFSLTASLEVEAEWSSSATNGVATSVDRKSTR